MIFLSGSAVVVAYHAIKGWQLGIVRQIFRVLALAAAYAAGYFAGKPMAPLLRPLGYPDLVLQMIAGAALGTVTYLVICLIAKILFKKTSDQEFWISKFLYGVTGALLGVVFGLFFVILVALAIRLTGTLVEASSAQPADSHAAATAQPGRKGNLAPAQNRPRPSPLLAGVVQLKKSLQEGLAGDALKTLDPIPESVYDVSRQLGILTANPEALSRLLSYPGALKLAQQPEITALRDDPQIGEAITTGHYLPLLRNERIIKAMNSPKVIELMKKFDFREALRYANERH